MSVLWSIYSVRCALKRRKKAATPRSKSLISADMVSKETIDASGYKFEVRLVPEGFEVLAMPVEYGKTGKLFVLYGPQAAIRGGDHAGGPASASDLPIGVLEIFDRHGLDRIR